MQPIPRRLSRCALGDELFEPGGSYISVLDQDGVRKDYCLACFAQTPKPAGGHLWRGTIPLKQEKEVHHDAQALELLRTLTDDKLRFVLALYLQRKKQLVRRTSTLYEAPATGEIFDVPPTDLTSQEEVIDELLHESSR